MTRNKALTISTALVIAAIVSYAVLRAKPVSSIDAPAVVPTHGAVSTHEEGTGKVGGKAAAASVSTEPKASGTALAKPNRPVPVVSQDLEALRNRADYASLYRKIVNDPSAEATYIRAEIYSRCARRKDGVLPAGGTEATAARRSKFVAGMVPGTPNASVRLDAFEKLNADPCVGVDAGEFSAQELASLIDRAANAGDPRAQAWRLAELVEGNYHADLRSGVNRAGYAISQDDLQQMRQLLATGSPEILQDLQGLISSSQENGVLLLNGTPIDPYAMHGALTLLACDVGAACGENAPRILSECAYRGQCGARSIYEYAANQMSPAELQVIGEYHRLLLSMLDRRDFSGLTLSTGATNPGASIVFGSRRPGP